MLEPRSLTAKYLRDELAIPVPPARRKATTQKLRVLGASEHNLKDIDVEIPLGLMVCVTGVSGSGKSTLVHDVIYAALKRAKGDWDRRVGLHRKLEGAEFVTDVVLVDQAPIGRTPRSNPVTYLKAFDPIRELFAATKDARARGLTASHFSFNVPGGRCEACEGEGQVKVEMQFLADVFVPCDQCEGKRFKPQVLEVKYRGRGVDQVLDMTVREALTFFSSSPKVLRRLQVLDEIGLGYLRLGQPATTLSGGEAQRIKIAAHLSSHTGDRVLYILDEPTTGLHFDDIAKLLAACRKLIQAGHSLLVIEHNLDVIKTADWVIDLGPEGGEAGGGRHHRHARTGRAGRGVAHRAIPPRRRWRSGGRTPTAATRTESWRCRRSGLRSPPVTNRVKWHRPPGSPMTRLVPVAAWCVAAVSCGVTLRRARRRHSKTSSAISGILIPRCGMGAVRMLHESGHVGRSGAGRRRSSTIRSTRFSSKPLRGDVFFLVQDVPSQPPRRPGRRGPRQEPGLAGLRPGPLATWPRPAPPELVDALLKAVDDQSARVRLEAIYALGVVARAAAGRRCRRRG